VRWQTTLVAALLLAIVSGFYYVYEIRLGPERDKAETRKGRVFPFETTDVTGMTLRRPDSVVKAVREGDTWQLREPLAAKGDRGPIEETLTTVVTAKMDREIDAAPKALGDFGLDKPAAEVAMTLKDGREVALLVGAKSPTGVWVYAKERDKPNVFVLGESVLRDATRPATDFRDKVLVSFSRADVTGIEIVTPSESIAVEPDGSKWKITRPIARPADPDTMSDVLEKVAAARVREFVAEAPANLATYGLDRPLRLVIHTGKEKDRASKAVLFGKADEAKKGVYAMREGEKSVLLVPDDVVKAVPQSTASLRDKTVVAFERDKVTRYEIESPKGNVTVVRDKDTWKITAPEALAADQVEAGAVLMQLRTLRAQAFLTDDASGIPRFLPSPEVKVTVHQDGAPPTTVLLAHAPDKRAGQATAYAGIAGQGPVVLVDAKAVDAVTRTAKDLRDRRIFADLQPKDVARVRIKVGGQTAVLERSGQAEWKIVEPAKAAAKSAKVEDLLYTLRALKWEDTVAPGAETPGRWGLDAPALDVELFKSGGGELGRLVVGKREGERLYAQSGKGPVYAVSARQLPDLPKTPDEFKE
jgi:hypothetical protein